MIWQQNVTQIVMLTNLMEGGKVMRFMYCIAIRKNEMLFQCVYLQSKFESFGHKGE